jgi:tight adherence protein B
MRARLLLLAALTLLGATVTTVTAAAQEQGALRLTSVDVGGYPDVRAEVSVPASLDGADASEQLRVLEDGEPVDADIAQSAPADLQIVMLIDTTGSMGDGPMRDARQAAASFLENLPADTPVTVAGYDVDLTIVTGFDATRDEQSVGIEELRAAGETAMYDAIVQALELFEDRGDSDRQAIVLLTDGEDNASDATLEEALEALERSGVVLHGVEYLTSFSDEAGIRALAEVTGGAVQSADDPDALVGIYDQLAADLISSYTIGYASERSGVVELTVEYDGGGDPVTTTTTLELPEPPAETPAAEATVEPAAPAPVESGDSLTGGAALPIGAAAWFGALVVLLLALFAPRQRRAQLTGASRASAQGTHEVADRVTAAAGRTLERSGYRPGLNRALERAGINLRPEEFTVLVACGTIAALVLGWMLSGPFGGVTLVAAVLMTARLTVSIRSDRRQRRFADQLGDTLQLLSGSLRAGYSLMQAVDAVARDADAPTSDEFGRLVVETRLGRSANDALDALAARLGSDDFAWVVQAIEIHREVGGDLAEVLDNVGNTIRERDRIRRQVRTVSAEGRMSGIVLLLLPVFIGLWMTLTNPSYIGELVRGPVGWAMLGTCAILMTAGTFWIRALVRPKF